MLKLYDFYADWCQPCKQLKPLIEELEKEFTVEKIDVDQNSEIAEKYGVMSLPTIIVMKDNEELGRFIGSSITKEKIKELMRK